MAKKTNLDSSGTSFCGVTLQATPKQLTKLFPESYYEENTGRDKTNFDFTLETEKGNVFTIYDYKAYRKLKMNEVVSWHIGGNSEKDCIEGRDEVLKMLK